jgi:DNA-directed RNA polymerase subunit H (RpoH/RPB5)|tara:strand:+ start:227 stop:856 length:630 start_codon:yes stop_codon:yes gene_type:complete
MAENRNNLAVHKSREVILNILKTRGFNISDYEGFSINEIYSLYTNDQLDLLITNETSKQKVYIKYFNLEKSIRPNNIHEIIEDLFTVEQILSPDDDLIIIIKDEPNDTLQKLQRYIFEHDKIFVTVINIDRLQFNILDHSIVPKHIVLNNEMKDIIKERYNIVNDSGFPTISRFDPVSQVLGIRPGNLCEITRSSKTAITSKYYRICSH